MTRDQRAQEIKTICGKCGCSEKLRKLHFTQFVEHNWQPHASLRFKNWWFRQQEFKDSQLKGEGGAMMGGIKAEVAQNVERIWQAYNEAKQTGAV